MTEENLQTTKDILWGLANPRSRPTEEKQYESWMNQSLWSIDEFCALMGGLTPENYKNGTKGLTKITDEEFTKRENFVTKLFTQFLDDMDQNYIIDDFSVDDENMFMSSWKFIKWTAEKEMVLKKRFFKALPLFLMELYLEFQPINVTLRTASHHTKAYHRALYLTHAKKLLKNTPTLHPSEIYKHPRMETVQYISNS